MSIRMMNYTGTITLIPITHPALPANQITWKSLLTLGISGGLVPCPDTIAILLVAVAVNRIPFGMLLILAFSIGLALVLIGIGIAMVQGVRFITRNDFLARFSVYAPVVSAITVSGLGIVLTVSALNSLNFFSAVSHSPASQSAAAFSSSKPTTAFDIRSAKLIYLAPDNQPRSENQLLVLPLSGGTPKQLTSEPSGISGYSISPDEKTILYTTFEIDGSSSISTIQIDGTQPRRDIKLSRFPMRRSAMVSRRAKDRLPEIRLFTRSRLCRNSASGGWICRRARRCRSSRIRPFPVPRPNFRRMGNG